MNKKEQEQAREIIRVLQKATEYGESALEDLKSLVRTMTSRQRFSILCWVHDIVQIVTEIRREEGDYEDKENSG